MTQAAEYHDIDETREDVLVMIALEVLRGLKNGDPSLPPKMPKPPKRNKTPRCKRIYTLNVFFAFRQHFQHAINTHIKLLTPYYPGLTRHARAVSGLVSPVWHAVKGDETVRKLARKAADRDREYKIRMHREGRDSTGMEGSERNENWTAGASEGGDEEEWDDIDDQEYEFDR